MTQPSFSTRGVVDLGALRAAPPTRPGGRVPTPPPSAGAAPPPAGRNGAGGAVSPVVAVTEADFQTVVLEQSMTVPVIVDFWATWCGPCKTLSPILEKLAEADAGRWLLATVDVDANPRLAGAFQVQSIPSIFAVLGGQPVPLFQGALPERQVRQYVDEVLRVAAANGVTGTLGALAPTPVGPGPAPVGAEVPEPAGPPLPPGISAALDALDRGDLDGAAAAYATVLADSPGDPAARAGMAQVELLRRAEKRDPDAVRRDAAAHPDDLAAQCDAADADLLDGLAEEAFARLVQAVGRTTGVDRERARRHLLELFEVVGSDDPRVAKARTALARTLF